MPRKKIAETCSLPNCSRVYFGKGFCQFHYNRNKKYGDPLREPPYKDLKSRLYKLIQKVGDCWEITTKDPTGNGYHRITIKNKKILVHRLSYEIHKGTIPEGALILHSCDNRRCVNPDHLYAGTHSDNMKDMWKRNPRKHHLVMYRWGYV